MYIVQNYDGTDLKQVSKVLDMVMHYSRNVKALIYMFFQTVAVQVRGCWACMSNEKMHVNKQCRLMR